MKCAQNAAHKNDGIIQTSPMVVIKKMKELPIWLKVATILEKPPPTASGVVSDENSSKWFVLFWNDENDFYSISKPGICW